MFKCKCGREFTTKNGLGYHERFCSKRNIFLDNGYECYIGNHGEKIYIHREILEIKLKRKMMPGEVAHHIDGNKRNNNPKNITLTTRAKHAQQHWVEKTDMEKESSIKAACETKGNKGKTIYGSSCYNAKLNETKVLEIKKKLRDGAKQTDLGKLYNIDRTVIRDIKYGHIWKHVSL